MKHLFMTKATWIFEVIQMKLIVLSATFSLFVAALNEYIKLYVFDDYQFLNVLAVLVTLDMCSGILKAFIIDRKKFSLQKFLQFVVKMFNCIVILSVIHIICRFSTGGDVGKEYFQVMGRSTCIIYFVISIIPNAYELSMRKLPIGWLMKIIDTAETKLNSDEPEKKST